MSQETTLADDGTPLPLDMLPQALAYAGTNLNTITVVYRGNTYIQTFSYTGTNLTGISRWIKQ